MKICETHEIKLFCKDYVERAEVMFILATVACALVIMSLVNYYVYLVLLLFSNVMSKIDSLFDVPICKLCSH